MKWWFRVTSPRTVGPYIDREIVKVSNGTISMNYRVHAPKWYHVIRRLRRKVAPGRFTEITLVGGEVVEVEVVT